MKTYYKTVTQRSFLKRIYHFDDCGKIPCDTILQAQMFFFDDNKQRVKIQSKFPVMHFTDNALDGLLWFLRLTDHQVWEATIYVVQPLTPIVKQICRDSAGFYQCGAEIIRIDRQLCPSLLINQIKQEFEHNQIPKENPYPSAPDAVKIYNWLLHDEPML